MKFLKFIFFTFQLVVIIVNVFTSAYSQSRLVDEKFVVKKIISSSESTTKQLKLKKFPEEITFNGVQKEYFANKDDSNVDPQCDDGKTNLRIDWDDSQNSNYTCNTVQLSINVSDAKETVHGYRIPTVFNAPQYCMGQAIQYESPIVTFGGYRPIWAKYGEYKFIPMQRWLHNAENGAIIMLYHPCAPKEEVEKLRNIVTQCLRRHIISPNNLIPLDEPIVLISWGWYMSMNVVKAKLVTRFIKEHALRGTKNISEDGKYTYQLETPAKLVSDEYDSNLCYSSGQQWF